jgi:acyl carrier protein
MNNNLVIEKLNLIFRDVLDDESISLTMETSAEDVPEWDSLNHIQLVVAIEKEYKIKFTSSEIQNWRNVGEICSAINNKV